MILPPHKRKRSGLPTEPCNLFAMGATRTGKSTCTGTNVLTSWLPRRQPGFFGRLRGEKASPPVGLLGLCVKPDEGRNLVRVATSVCPRDEVVHVTLGGEWTFDPLSSYFSLPGASATQAAKMLCELSELGGRFEGKESEPFWEIGKQRTLYNSLLILQAAYQEPTTEQLYDFLTSLPDPEDLKRRSEGVPSRFENSFAGVTAALAIINTPPEKLAEIRRATGWLTREQPFVADKTRSGFNQAAIQAAFPFTQYPVAGLCRGSTLKVDLLNRGYKVALDVPVIPWGLPALLWQSAVRYICDVAMCNRPRAANVVLKYCDEYQWLAMPAHDARVATLSSGARYHHVFLTQSVQTMLDALGGTEHARAQMDSILGNSPLKIFHWNDCEHTQKLMAQLSGQCKEYMASSGGGDAANYDLWDDLGITGTAHKPHATVNFTEHWTPVFKPEWGQLLKRAGLPHGYSEALVIEAGRPARVEHIPMILFEEE